MSYRRDKDVLDARLRMARLELANLDEQRSVLRRRRQLVAEQVMVLEQHLAVGPRQLVLVVSRRPDVKAEIIVALERAVLHRVRVLAFVASYGLTIGGALAALAFVALVIAWALRSF